MNDAMVQINDLTKYYDGRCILDDINLNIPQGCIYGLLGRNGSGKTTIIRILLGLEPPTRGSTALFGVDSFHLSAQQRGCIGYVAEGHNLIQKYSVGKLTNLCRSLAIDWDQTLYEHLLQTFNLPKERKINKLSAGMRAQLNLALAMAVNPQLLIMDDPSLGLDTIARRQFLELAIDLIQKKGRTILFSSHILSDVERIADRIGILRAGKLIVDCSLTELKQRVKKFRIIFPDAAPADLHLNDIIQQQNDQREMTLTVANWNAQKQTFINTFNPESCSEIPMSLEDIFIECSQIDQVSLNHQNESYPEINPDVYPD